MMGSKPSMRAFCAWSIGGGLRMTSHGYHELLGKLKEGSLGCTWYANGEFDQG
ncbi:hypothetical protein GUITHDRAFT_150587 [Guillardia theta CCMP2712]|uniref:Uncharacterized protein n=1 Tax=Guillardia theta (strain CCMP2712) TaxID=905079 RepID=L1JW17_GUITC|nr:hypothetical protein GUITHDRAFT_150587 [Guillardia theta CCMP2712]EKX52582.1 hypothetical protein GUITHDRAFT_150587 [Guillardia theta CCMP2712]|eukprot:XP_005839562.1 hypothetical protein GUITHDRAFT_150587 [Guillardia theta CCMP2712]